MTALELHALIATEREQAHAICAEKGEGDPACRVAWDIVEELLAARADRQEAPVTAFGRFCLEHPEAIECRVYDL